MRLKTITLNNFRCFKTLEVGLHPRLTVFVGENGAGKTALLDGIASVFTPAMTYFSSANQRLTGRGIKDADFRVEPYTGRGGKEQWGVADFAQVKAETFDGMRWDYWRPSSVSKGAEPAEKWGETALKEHIGAIVSTYKTQTPALTPAFAYYGASRGHIEVPERLRGAKNNYDHPTAALVDCFNPRSDFREMLEWFDLEESSELRANKGLVDDNFVFFESLSAVRTALTSVLDGAYRNPCFNSKHKFTIERTSDGAPMQVSQLSQGYQSMLALAMDFARRMAIANSYMTLEDEHTREQIFTVLNELSSWGCDLDDPFQVAPAMSAPAIMLVDEIDLHLHPSWQQRVLQDLLRTFPLTQFIVTTHSPQVLSTIPRENIRVLEQTDDGMRLRTPDFSPLAHESGDALAKIMGTHREPPMALQDDIRRYEQLVRAGQENQPDAQALRATLEQAGYQFHDSDLTTWRFLATRKAGTAGAAS